MEEEKLRQAVSDYRPNEEVSEAIKNITVVATVGPSASGKTTIMHRTVKTSPGIYLILSETSRQPRVNEREGLDYVFRSKEAIIRDMQEGALIQVAIGPNGDLYCTRVRGYPKSGVGIIALVPATVQEFRRLLPAGFFTAAFIAPESFEAWQQWFNRQAIEGGWTPQQKQKRLEEAVISFEFALSDSQMRFVLNDNIDDACKRFIQVIRGQTPDNEDQARTAAKNDFEQLKRQLLKE